MIDRRELLAKARERHLPLNMIEKDYVLGWVLFGLREVPGLVFKGGTALAKVYFPETWRLSEDLDFAAGPGEWGRLPERIAAGLKEVTDRSGIELAVRSTHSNGNESLDTPFQFPRVTTSIPVQDRVAPSDKERESPAEFALIPIIQGITQALR